MFYCEKCKNEHEWPGIVPLSYRNCELRGKTAPCYDIPSNYLPVPKGKEA